MINKRLKAARKANQYTVKDLAPKIGIASATLYRYENDRAISFQHGAKFCEFIGISMEWLATGEVINIADAYADQFLKFEKNKV